MDFARQFVSGERVKSVAEYLADGFPQHVAEFMAGNPPPPFEVAPDNWPAALMFSALQTQWRIGMNGATGLDYAVLPAVFDLHGVATEDRGDVFECLRIMEGAALEAMAEEAAAHA